MYCGQCGTQNARGSRFCNNCGAALDPSARRMQGAPVSAPRRRQPGCLQLIFALIVLIVIAGIVGNATNGGQQSAAPPVSDTPVATDTVGPTDVPAPTDTPEPPAATATVALPVGLDHAGQQIAAATLAALKDSYYFSTDTSDYLTVSYPTIGWSRNEPLIREIIDDPSGTISIWFSAASTGDSYIDVSDYNQAEMAVVDVLAFIAKARIQMNITDVAVAAWAPVSTTDCSSMQMDRIAFAHVDATQLRHTPFGSWGDLNGDQMFAQLKARSISEEIYNPYRVCPH